MKQRRHFSAEFKSDSASLVIDQGYSVQEACKVVAVGESTLRSWVKQLSEERHCITPIGSKALTPEQRRIQELEVTMERIEWEKAILKKHLCWLSNFIFDL